MPPSPPSPRVTSLPALSPSFSLPALASSWASTRTPLHLTGVQGSALALLLARLFHSTPTPHSRAVVFTEDLRRAQALHQDLRAFAPELRVALLPAPEQSPFDAVRADRRISLARSSALAQWGSGQLELLLVPAASFLRKVISPEEARRTVTTLTPSQALELPALALHLTQSGYQRVELVEDVGSFALRGSLLDLWPAGAPAPVRVELEFDVVHSLRRFDPDTQRTLPGELSHTLLIPPAQEVPFTPEACTRAERLVQELCDSLNYPSTKTRQLVQSVKQGQLFFGGDTFLPAYAELVPLAQYWDQHTWLLFEEPDAFLRAAREEQEELYASSLRNTEPAFPPSSYFLSPEELTQTLQELRSPQLCVHSTRILGDPSSHSVLGAPQEDSPHLGSQDQSEFVRHGEHLRKTAGKSASLNPLVQQIQAWQEEGYSVLLSARTKVQEQRLASLLEHRGLRFERLPALSVCTAREHTLRPGELALAHSPLSRGLLLPEERLALLTEEEIFGKRAVPREKKARAALQNTLDDLRSLHPGDYIIHVEHGVGRYLGLEHKTVNGSAIDLLVVEYQGGDKLFLPSYRLNQVQKLTTPEAAPRLDRLGGQSFAKTKQRAKKKVRELTDQLLRLYAERKSVERPPLDPPGEEYATFEAAFPYEETPDQLAAIADVLADLQKNTVMDRLICGDVGFGKTEVALRAAYLHLLAGHQVALLCPTTVLAEQHFRTFSERLADTGVEVHTLSRFQTKKQQTLTLAGLKSGSVDLVVGTHRLLSQDVHFKNLGLLIVDEEQRFGVTHKERMKELRKHVDVLTLSATPIPRTLSFALGGLRDLSVISTPPVNRRSIRTFTSQYNEQLLTEVIQRELNRGGQVYYVQNRIEGLYERAARIQELMPHVRIAVGHGKLSESTLEKTMLGFVDGQYDLLVTTTIIESGLDIPRANTMIIDRADRMGLTQLYQLRGRVGRSAERAYCYLFVPSPQELSDDARSRLEILERYTELGSGFQIASLDMELRGTGELLGAEQSGFVSTVGFELFTQMLEEAAAEWRGERYQAEIEPDLSIQIEALLPETYIEEIGLRLSLYKKLSSAANEHEVALLAEEMTDRFGEPPPEALRYIELMRLKAELRRFRVLGCSATEQTVSLHLAEDTPLTPEQLVSFLAQNSSRYTLSPDGKLTRRSLGESPPESGLAHADRMLSELNPLLES